MNEIANKLNSQADRLKNIMTSIENGKIKVEDVDLELIENLGTIVSKYEELLKQEER